MLLTTLSIENPYHHLLTFKDTHDKDSKVIKEGMNDIKALFALFALALFSNVFNKQTYMSFIHGINGPSPQEWKQQQKNNLNTVSFLEKRHYYYMQGLIFDLIIWFFNYYALCRPDEKGDNAYNSLLVPFITELTQKIIIYKVAAEANDKPGFCDAENFKGQIDDGTFLWWHMRSL